MCEPVILNSCLKTYVCVVDELLDHIRRCLCLLGASGQVAHPVRTAHLIVWSKLYPRSGFLLDLFDHFAAFSDDNPDHSPWNCNLTQLNGLVKSV